MSKLRSVLILAFLLALLIFVLIPAPAYAHHTWNNYHWSRGSNPFVLSIGDNVSSKWEPYLSWSSYYWNNSSVLDTRIIHGNAPVKHCRGDNAHIQVCSSSYGETGWLGLAQVGVNGNHILYGTVRMNDTYFNKAKYNTPAWKHLVMCQEVGHAFGLGHQDENFSNTPLGTCMDYTNSPQYNQRPNSHDYQQLLSIYAHRDTRTRTAGTRLAAEDTTIAGEFNTPSEWGTLISGATKLASGGDSIATYERDLGSSKKVRTVVIWAK